MKNILLILVFLISVFFNCFADEAVKSYKEKGDEYDIEQSFYFKAFIVNNTEDELVLKIFEDKNSYGEIKIGKGEFKADPLEVNQTEIVWKKGWAVQREINTPVLTINGEHPTSETALVEAKLTPGKKRTAKDAVEIIFHKKIIHYDKQNLKVRFEVSGNSDVLFMSITKDDDKEHPDLL